MKNRNKESRNRIGYLMILCVFTIILFIIATYAWFSTQKNISINELKGTVEVAEGLQISLDAEVWSQEINFNENEINKEMLSNTLTTNTLSANWTDYDAGIGSVTSSGTTYTTKNVRPRAVNYIDNTVVSGSADDSTGYLLPVSSSGATLNKNMIFYTGTYAGVSLRNISAVTETDQAGYYAFDVYLMNTTKGTADDTLQLNFNSLVNEIKSGSGTDYGLKNCVRVAFAVYDQPTAGKIQTEATQETIVSQLDGVDIKQVAIWEPNADTHSTYILKQNSMLDTLVKAAESASQNYLTTYAINSIPSDNKIANVYTTDVSSTGLVVQKTNKTSGEVIDNATLNGETVYANGTGVLNLTDTNETEVKLVANSISKVRIYIWLEGQDQDCINWASHSGGIDVTIGLCKGSTPESKTES